MADIGALLQADEKEFSPSEGNNKAMFPFWNAPFNSTTLIRFLPFTEARDVKGTGLVEEPSDELPWIEKRQIRLTFDGMVNSERDTTELVTCTVPSPQTWGLTCPISEDIKPLWQGSDAEKELARKYYRKPTYLFHAFVVSSPITEVSPPDNPIRRLHLNKSLFNVIKSACTAGEFDDAPWDYEHGRDFKLVKTQQGAWANYTSSGFSFKERALNGSEKGAIATYGLSDLRDQPGPAPDKPTIDMIFAMYQDSLHGRPFDNAKYGGKFRAYAAGGSGGSANTTSIAAAMLRSAPASTPAVATKSNAKAILTDIHNRMTSSVDGE